MNSAGGVQSRHDYLPFGEDLSAGVGMRTPGQMHGQPDGIRQKYAGMESDDATGLDHTLWRKYDSMSARWTSPDPYGGSMTVANPQTFNRYAYVENDPLNQVDILGLTSRGMSSAPDPSSASLTCQYDFIEFGGTDGYSSVEVTDPSSKQEPVNLMTATDGNQEHVAIDKLLAELFTDVKNGGMVSGVGAYRNLQQGDTHFRLATGEVHSLHIFYGVAGTDVGGVYIPSSFSEIRYAGGGKVTATNPKNGQTIGIAHITVTSQKQLNANLKTTNAAGSRFIGNIGGAGGEGANDTHSHLTIYNSAENRLKALEFKGNQTKRLKDFDSQIRQYLGDFRTLVH